MFPRSRLVACLAVVGALALSGPPAHAADAPGNDSCGSATTLPPAWGTGSLDGSADTTDFYSLSANANDEFWIEMNPGYAPTSGKNYDLYLRNPSCTVVASSTWSGISIERITNYVAASTGTYYVEVRWVSGTGLYDLAAFADNQGPVSCSASKTPAVLTVSYASCPLGSQTCATASCTYRVRVTATGTGVVSADFFGVSCTGALSCDSGDVTFSSSTFSGVCTSALGATVAASVTVRCTVTQL